MYKFILIFALGLLIGRINHLEMFGRVVIKESKCSALVVPSVDVAKLTK